MEAAIISVTRLVAMLPITEEEMRLA